MKIISILLFTIFALTSAFGQTDQQGDSIEYIKKETIGGALDFNKILEGEEEQALFTYDEIAYNKKDFAIYLWGINVKMMGIKSSKKATSLWEEINNQPLTKPEKKALVNGFKSKYKLTQTKGGCQDPDSISK